MTEQQAGISRRTVIRTAAWAAPVVLIAVAAPAAAASGITDAQFDFKPTPSFTNQGEYRLDVQPGIITYPDGATPVISYSITVTISPIPPGLTMTHYFTTTDGTIGGVSPEGFTLGSAYDPATGSYTVNWTDPGGTGLTLPPGNPYVPYGPNLESFFSLAGAAPAGLAYSATVTAANANSNTVVVPLT